MDAEKKLTASLEDYLEVILSLSADGCPARSRDIASSLEVSRSSVTGALKELADRWGDVCSAPEWCDCVDLDFSERIGLGDFAIMAENWLKVSGLGAPQIKD